MTDYYANVADLIELDRAVRMIVSEWVDTGEIHPLDRDRVDGDYALVCSDDAEQREARAAILSDKFGARTESRE